MRQASLNRVGSEIKKKFKVGSANKKATDTVEVVSVNELLLIFGGSMGPSTTPTTLGILEFVSD